MNSKTRDAASRGSAANPRIHSSGERNWYDVGSPSADHGWPAKCSKYWRAYAVGSVSRCFAAKVLGNGDPLTQEIVLLKADALRRELAGETPTPLESLLVGHVVIQWMELAHAQMRAADPRGGSLAQAALEIKRAESAQRKYLAAMKTLAVVRHLLPRGLMPSASPRLFDPVQKLA